MSKAALTTSVGQTLFTRRLVLQLEEQKPPEKEDGGEPEGNFIKYTKRRRRTTLPRSAGEKPTPINRTPGTPKRKKLKTHKRNLYQH